MLWWGKQVLNSIQIWEVKAMSSSFLTLVSAGGEVGKKVEDNI